MVTVLALIVAVVALGVAVVALRRADVVERRARRWLGDEARPAAAAAGPAPAAPAVHSSGLSRVGLARYDAFEDVGGRMSFSVALLDATGSGIVLTAIHGRAETRSYVKEVPVPAEARALSPEESQAVAAALKSRPL